MALNLILPMDYGYVVAAVGVIGIVQLVAGGMASNARKVFQTVELLENPKFKALQDEHKKLFGANVSKEGYPDMGSGRYSDLLTYEHWHAFNCAQRGHYNMLETSAPVLASTIVFGLYQPKLAAGLGFIYAISRVIYSLGYVSGGPQGRMIGSGLSILSCVSLFGGSIFYGLKAVGKL